jgi:hypothetical protein
MSSIFLTVQDRGTTPGTCFMPRSDHGEISPRWISSCEEDIGDPLKTRRAGQRSAVDPGALVSAQYPSPDGFGNCTFSIDLGAHDSAKHGLFLKATV